LQGDYNTELRLKTISSRLLLCWFSCHRNHSTNTSDSV